MNLNDPIAATITRDRHGQPLIILDGQPFNGVECSPHKLRSLAQQLAGLADISSNTVLKGKFFKPMKVTLSVANTEVQAASLSAAFDDVFSGMFRDMQSAANTRKSK
jgi:hypothetical protein